MSIGANWHFLFNTKTNQVKMKRSSLLVIIFFTIILFSCRRGTNRFNVDVSDIEIENVKIGDHIIVRVRAKNKIGFGEWSEYEEFTITGGKPERIKIISTEFKSDDSVYFEWNKPKDRGNSIDYYEIRIYMRLVIYMNLGDWGLCKAFCKEVNSDRFLDI